MDASLILGRRSSSVTNDEPARLPEHHYDHDVCANVDGRGRLLVFSAPAADVADYTGTQNPNTGTVKTDD